MKIETETSDDELLQFIDRVKVGSPSDSVVAAELATALARSGEMLGGSGAFTADVASTGGPTSLSTLLCPLYLRVAGCTVPKLGVAGRPAGGIDCLAQIPGYHTQLNIESLRVVLQSAGYAHFLAAGQFAPLDARLFRLRQCRGAQDVPTLVCASIVAKKIALGVDRVGLDVRVADHGNFGRNWSEASANALLFVETARRCGIEAFPVLTDGRFPYQPFVGRREALVAIWQVLSGRPSRWLQDHARLCQTIALACLPAERRSLAANATLNELREAFDANVVAHGAARSALDELAERTLASHDQQVCARSDGFVATSLVEIRDRLVAIQRQASAKADEFPDPAGVILLRRPGEWVPAGEPLATIRVEPCVASEDLLALADVVSAVRGAPLGLGFEAVPENG